MERKALAGEKNGDLSIKKQTNKTNHKHVGL